MSAYYKANETKERPGLYRSIENADQKYTKGGGVGCGPGNPEMIVKYYAEIDTVSVSADGIVLTYDGIGTVGIVGLPAAYSDGKVKLGG